MIKALEGKYAVTMDMYPLQGKEFNRNYLFYEHLKEGRLTTTRCRDCGKKAFPPRVICPECYSENLEWVDLPTRGRVLVVTEEEVGVPLGFETPLIHALIDLGGELTMFARVINVKRGELKEGDEVKMTVFPVDPVPVEGKKGAVILQERVFFAFEKA
ncbi:MAG: zinc ribbon domain-containing protein [Bacillota bacterium]